MRLPRRRGRARWLGQLAVGAALTAGCTLLGGFLVFTQTLDRGTGAPPPHADAIVALTGGVDRVQEALGLLVDGRADRLLISGVNRATSRGDLSRSYPADATLLRCCVDLGYAAETTVGNAREVQAWTARHGIRSLIVVTSNYHMPRAIAEIADAVPGLTLLPFPVVIDPADDRDWWSDGQRLRLLATEYAKWLVVKVRTRLLPAAPYRDGPAALGTTGGGANPRFSGRPASATRAAC